MPKGISNKLPCPYCPYEAFGEDDLASHAKFAHGADKPAAEAKAIVEATPEATPSQE
ncbi:hypothetical protein LCGC14_2236830, partial [marine sediment metagenome]